MAGRVTSEEASYPAAFARVVEAVEIEFDADQLERALAECDAILEQERERIGIAEHCLRRAELALQRSKWELMGGRDPTRDARRALELVDDARANDADVARAAGIAALAHLSLCNAPGAVNRILHAERLVEESKRALAADAGEANARYAFGVYLLQRKRSSERAALAAVKHLSVALPSFKHGLGCRAMLAVAHQACGDQAEAARELERVRMVSAGFARHFLEPALRRREKGAG